MPSDGAPVHSEDGLWGASQPVDTTYVVAAPDSPARGDVLIRTLHAGSPRPCALSAFPGPDQIAFPSQRVATSHARAYARQAGVDVWEDAGAGRLVRLLQFRASFGGPVPLKAGDAAVSSAPGTDIRRPRRCS